MSGTVALAVLGDPLAYTLSPLLHRAGCASLGVVATSEALRTAAPDLGARLRDLAARGYRGVNLTAPLKEPALEHLDRVSEASRLARSVNTVGFEADGWWGDTTDGPGLVDLLSSLGRSPGSERAVLLGAGGAARSLALALLAAGAEVSACARDPGRAAATWAGIPRARLIAWGSDERDRAVAASSLVIQATPLDGEEAFPLDRIPAHALILDLTYGPEPTEWVRAARRSGRQAYDGLGLLVFQGRLSLALWFARPVAVDPLASAVGWPR